MDSRHEDPGCGGHADGEHRVEGCQPVARHILRHGQPEREFNGEVLGLQQTYRDGIEALGADFAGADAEEQDARLSSVPQFKRLVYQHACEGMYAAPEYGGNQGLVGWRYIGYEGDVQPRGYTDEEVEQP